MDSAVRDVLLDIGLVAWTISACLVAFWLAVGTVAGCISAGCDAVASIRRWYAAPQPTLGGPFVDAQVAPGFKDCTFGPAPDSKVTVRRKRRSRKA